MQKLKLESIYLFKNVTLTIFQMTFLVIQLTEKKIIGFLISNLARIYLYKVSCIFFTAMIASLQKATYGDGVTNLYLTVRLALPSLTKRNVVVTLREDLRKCRCKTLSLHSDPILISGFVERGKLVLNKRSFAAYSHHLLKKKLRFYGKKRKTLCLNKKRMRSQ